MIADLFAYSYNSTTELSEEDSSKVIEVLRELDSIISTHAPEWPLNQINRIDLSILRLAVYELTNQTAPTKVLIDEAVELGKEFGSESSSKFINGVLGSFLAKKT